MVQIKGGETGAIVRERLIIIILTLLKDFSRGTLNFPKLIFLLDFFLLGALMRYEGTFKP